MLAGIAVAVATGSGWLLADRAAAAPSLSLTSTDAVVGEAIHATAELAESPDASGEISFEVFGPDDSSCEGPALTPAPAAAAVTGEGPYDSGNFIPSSPGDYHWSAKYSGDLVNPPAETLCSAFSTVSKASPALTGTASSGTVGQTIGDEATLASGFSPSGQLVFRAFGPGDEACAAAPLYEDSVAIGGNGVYSPSGFAPGPGLYRWTVEYGGDANNLAAATVCGDPNQSSAVGTIDVTLAVSASGGTIGDPVSATATIAGGAIPGGQLAFKAFPPGDANCSGTAAFSSAVEVAGNGPYRSAAFTPARVGTYRWTVAYSGDANHAPTSAGCGKASSSTSQAKPSIAGAAIKRLMVGRAFRDWVTLQGGHSPTGTITFRIYGPVASGCAKPISINTVAIAGNGTYKSDPFVAQRPGRYSFVASYSGDAANQAATEPCDAVGQATQVTRRKPKLKPRALLIGGKRISIRAKLSGGASPSGLVSFRLYGPGHARCTGRPAFSGGITVKSNGSFSLAEYLATKPGVYRLEVNYSGDRRNLPFKGTCKGSQTIRVV